METKKIASIYDLRRMCHSFKNSCYKCPLHDEECDPCCTKEEKMDVINEAVIKWCEEHPVKTRQSEFLKIYPNASVDIYGSLTICPKTLDKTLTMRCLGESCTVCRKKFWSEEIE